MIVPMLEVVQEKLSEEEPCPYLPERSSQMSYRLLNHCSVEDYERLLRRGWRRFGRTFFRPCCDTCRECRSLRLEVESFSPNRSMRRTRRKNHDLETHLTRPTLSEEHYALYLAYHRDMIDRRGWQPKVTSLEDYYFTFIDGYQDFGFELQMTLGGKLVGVALIDLLPRAVSAVYCYYEPGLRDRALGVMAVLEEVELARAAQIAHLYLGYWVRENRSMRYKANYAPHQLLQGRPPLDRSPEWVSPTSPASPSGGSTSALRG